MKKKTSFGFFAIFMALLFFLSMNIQFEHTKNQSKYRESVEIEEGWRSELAGLPRGIVQSESDLEMKPLGGDSRSKKHDGNFTALLAMAVGISQKQNVDLMVSKFLLADCSVILFHYDGNVDEWREFEWSDRAIHILAHNQTKWWFAKRFLHPDVVSIYDYVFLWDEDLGVENFHPGRYMELMFSEGLEISQPALDPELSSEIHHRITVRDRKTKVHRRVYDYRGSLNCSDESKGPPCTGWIEGMAPVFSQAAWRCVWHLIQLSSFYSGKQARMWKNDLIHGWGLDMKLGYCAQGDRTKKVGVIDTEVIVHLGIPSLGGASATKAPSYKNVDLRTHIRRQSTAELQKFKKRWNRAVREDKEWSKRFGSLTRRKE